MMPKAYRLSMNSMAVIMDNYATCESARLNALLISNSQLPEQYGSDVTSEILARSRSNLQLDKMPYASSATVTGPTYQI
jgi:hypothetical protein